MKPFTIKLPLKQVTFMFPSKLEELTKDYLTEVTKNVKIANNYSLIGIVYHESLGNIVIARQQKKKDITAGVIPIFIKCGQSDSQFVNNIKTGSKVIISGTQLALGHHVACPANKLSIDYLIKCINDSDDKELYQRAIKLGKEHIFLLEFKLVPNCDIVGAYDNKPYDVNASFVTEHPINGMN